MYSILVQYGGQQDYSNFILGGVIPASALMDILGLVYLIDSTENSL